MRGLDDFEVEVGHSWDGDAIPEDLRDGQAINGVVS